MIKVAVELSAAVESLSSMVECEDRVEFIEQLAAHLKDGQYETSKDASDRRILQMTNVVEARQITMSPNQADDE